MKKFNSETSFSASINITGFKTEVAKDNAEKRLAYDLAEEIRKEILIFQKRFNKLIIKDYNFQQFLENIPTEKKIFLLHGTLISKIWYYRKLLELKLVGPKALQQMKLVLVDKSTIEKDKNNLLNEIKLDLFLVIKKRLWLMTLMIRI